MTLRRQFPPWYDASVRRALKLKEAAFNRTKRNKTPDTVSVFEEKRKSLKNLSCVKYREYIRGMIGAFKSNPKRFWSFLKCVKGTKRQLPVLCDGDREVSGDVERANLLNRTFAAKFTCPDVENVPDAPTYDLPILDQFTVSATAIRSALDDLQVHKACGPDNISARIIKECADQLVTPLSITFRLSVEQGVFPSKWSEANIVPIFKKGFKKLHSKFELPSGLSAATSRESSRTGSVQQSAATR